MGSPSRILQVAVWGMVIATMIGVAAAYFIKEMRAAKAASEAGAFRLPNAPLEAAGGLPVLFPVPDFALTNQAGALVRSSDLRGNVWISDIIFTRCAGPCPAMTQRMAELQAAISQELPVRFVTLTTDPDHDTPSVLARYASRYLASPDRWHFLTGTKRQIVGAAVNGLKFTSIEKEALHRADVNDLFIHATVFVVVDKKGRARAVLESDDPALRSKALGVVQLLVDE